MSSDFTAIGSSARRRTPKTWSRRPCWQRGAAWTNSANARRPAPRCTGSRPTVAPIGRDRAPLPNSRREREVVGRFADAVESGDIDTVVALLTDDAWLRMPPQPYEYQGAAAIGQFLDDRAVRRGAPLRLVPTRANGQP